MPKGIRIAVLAVVLLLAAYLGATYLVGYFTQKELSRQLAIVSAQTTGLETAITSYDRSFFSSSVVTELTFSSLKTGQAAAPSIIFQSELQHGPLILAGEAAPALLLLSSESKIVQTTGGWAELLNEIPELKELIFTDRLTCFLQYQHHSEFPGMDRQLLVDGNRLSLQLSAITADFTGELWPEMTLQGQVLFPAGKLQLPAEGVVVAQQNFSLDLDVQQMMPALYAGSSILKIESLFASSSKRGEEFFVEMDALEISAMVDMVNGMLAERVTAQLEKLQVNDDTYGPVLADIAIGSLDAQLLSRYQQELSSAKRVLVTSKQNSPAFQQLQRKMQQLALQLLKKSPHLKLAQLEVKTPFGKLVSSGKAQIKGTQVQGIDPPEQLLAALVADADLLISKELIQEIVQLTIGIDLKRRGMPAGQAELQARQQAKAEIERWLADSILIDAGDNYSLQAKVTGGSAFVNGRKVQ